MPSLLGLVGVEDLLIAAARCVPKSQSEKKGVRKKYLSRFPTFWKIFDVNQQKQRPYLTV